MPETEDLAPSVKSARRVMDLLDLLAGQPAGLTFVEIREHLELPKSSLHLLLRTMTDRGYIAADARSRRFHLGVRVWEVGQGFVRGADLAMVAHEYLVAAKEELGETVQLAILDGLENIYIAKVDAEHPLQLVSKVGRRLPAHATGLGKVLLAYVDEDDLLERLRHVELERFTEKTVVDHEELFGDLKAIRQQGYGLDDGEFTAGVYCIAVPVLDHTGRVVAAMSCSVPNVRLSASEEGTRQVALILHRHAEQLSRRLGGSGLPLPGA
ncbi:IclR family transcriptional regulator [Micromonospora sonchi]|uniref:Glycerol operon regulatory protein n=1 Tax=Micromonospora sonchi TaxID=1763543 RepID=A0A917X3I5_9ACTN|nr:IclR family transcriptional regulator [Micromonospora sonchi]GGM65918.1 IclR family transcriptional regulator [Micromonospora sonchi]